MKKDFNRLLKEIDADDMREELRVLYDRFPVVREYYKMELGESTKAVVDKYKADLRKAFFSSKRRVSRRGRSESKKVLKAFSLVSIHPRDLVELYFYRAEVMAEAVVHYRIENDSFLLATVKAFEEALVLAEKELLIESYHPQIEQLSQYFGDHVRYGDYSFWPLFREYFGEG
ncbi:DUF6155 family protein [Neolewinella antarctica]|uniref:Uncharacterized protein n=1 Tax=Neolewinella antarctica TaxID=442734 RepID=A0ABX0XEJ9_9BACT|nr:DUF6155 family protein [Neolewinella antarctica]NJC27720.1 hypothetical protein [Neolewinella antarctica]